MKYIDKKNLEQKQEPKQNGLKFKPPRDVIKKPAVPNKDLREMLEPIPKKQKVKTDEQKVRDAWDEVFKLPDGASDLLKPK